jgi:hypothetical protein
MLTALWLSLIRFWKVQVWIADRSSPVLPAYVLEKKILRADDLRRESLAMSSVSGLQMVLHSPRPSDQLLNDAIEEIDAALEDRDLGRLLQAILSVVPEYSQRASLTDCAGADGNDNSTAAAIRKDFANLTARIRPPERNQSPSWFRFTTFYLRLISTRDFFIASLNRV